MIFGQFILQQENLLKPGRLSIILLPPAHVLAALAKSQYKDWAIVGNKEIIRFYHDRNNSSVEQHFRLTVQKDNVKRSISFNFQRCQLINKEIS